MPRRNQPPEGEDEKAVPQPDQETAPSAHFLPLARGELSPHDAQELGELKRIILKRYGFDLKAYKEPCLRRRLAVRMRARGIHSYSDYGKLLGDDPTEGARMLDAITINVSKFYRNAETWDALIKLVVPALFKLTAPRIKIWSAGCASGEEPYTMAMVLTQYAEQHQLTSKLRRFEILGTDVDKGVLELAARGEYGPFSFGEIAPVVRDRFFEENRLRPEIKNMVQFAELDLMTGPYPEEQHLIFCRNVIIYFERPVQERLFKVFHQSLQPGGFLFLGKVETMFGTAAGLFEPIASRERIFCKV
jgi:chemotaxis protein methyltransferase CheR